MIFFFFLSVYASMALFVGRVTYLKKLNDGNYDPEGTGVFAGMFWPVTLGIIGLALVVELVHGFFYHGKLIYKLPDYFYNRFMK